MIKTFTLCFLNGTSYCNTCFVLNIFNFVFKWLVIRFVINNIFEVQMGSDKWFINTKSASQGIFTHDLLIISITLKHLLILLWIWSLKFSCWSSTNRKFFWKEQATTFVLLNVTESQLTLLAFLEKYTSCACLLGSGLNYIFHWETQLLIDCKFLFGSLCYLYLSETCENRDVLLAKVLQIDYMLSGKSLMCIKNEKSISSINR